ncbi:hypothetical protein QQZ08_003516 [Neonectria magnoliae]|uniref:Uncharacterized protein n=1 Tax=Neonectria magnoliae TaxID=2732573 RepID=A0ABR1I8H2_9HYPO
MALWPFRRRSGRKRPRSGAALSDAEGGPPISPTEGTKAGSKKKRRTEPPRPLRSDRTYSFEPGRQDSLRLDGDRRALRAHDRSGLRNNTNTWDEGDAGAWDRTPTLHNKHRNHHPTRRKDAKKREAEIKAMSNFTPVRPAAEQWTSGRPMKKDSKKAKTTSFGRQGETRNSDVSLPPPGSIHSSLSSDSEIGSYTLSALDALAPRPTLRYAQCPRISPPPPPAHLQPTSHRRRLVDREPLPEATLKAHKRVDSLADDLDASDLRELMERDNRRREKRKQKEQARMERRLAKRAEEQKTEALESRKKGTPPPENLERGVVGRELAGLGTEPASAVVTSSKQRNSGECETMPDSATNVIEDPPKRPLEAFHRTDTMPTEEKPTPAEEPTPMEVDTPREGSTITRPSEDHPSSLYSNRLAGILRSVKSRSKSTLRSERDKMVSPPPETIDEEPRRGSRDSNSSTKTARFSIRALFRFGSRRRRNSNSNLGPNSGPSSFSNTSREEMQAIAAAVRTKAQAQARALARLEGEDLHMGNYLARKPSSSVPKRTRSRFREDLPELPISPPASRVQSPEPEPPVPELPQSKIDEIESMQPMGMRYETPTSGHRSIEAQRRTPTSMERAYASPSPEAQLSTSLASIDSEGSWMSGKKDARLVALRNSLRRANRQEHGNSISDTPTNSTEEDLAITEDEYLSKLTPRPNPSHKEMRQRAEEPRPSDEEDLVDNSDMKWGAVGSQPQVVNRATIKSVEGLLDIESENEDSESSPISPVSRSSELADVQRAKSVHLGKGHVRNFSAGSAKLLEITPRLSADRRASTDRRSSNAVVM